MLEIGINTNNECGESFYDTCNNIKETGFGSVMIALLRGQEEKQFECVKNFGLNIQFVHLDNSSNDMWVQGYSHDKQKAVYKKQIDMCAKYGVPIAILHATIGDPCYKVITPNDYALNEFKNLVEYAKTKNVLLALENVDDNSYEHFSFLLNNIESDNFGFCYDVGHHNLYNKNINFINLYGERLFAVHLHDNWGNYKIGDDFTHDLHLLPFDGNIDFEKVIQQLKKVQYKNAIMLEVHKSPVGEPKIYNDLTNLEFLNKAKYTAEKLIGMIRLK